MTPEHAFRELRAEVERLHGSVNTEWDRPADKTVQLAIEDARLIAEFVVGYVLKDDVGEVIEERVRSSQAFVDSITAMRRSFEDFRSCLLAVGKAGTERESVLVAQLDEHARNLRERAESTVDHFAAVLDDPVVGEDEKPAKRAAATEAVAEIRRQLRARWLLDQTERTLDGARQAQAAAEDAAGVAGAKGVGQYYLEHAEKEARIADRLRAAVVALLTTVAAGFIVLNFLSIDFTVGTELLRLSATIPLAALAAYLMRESSKHRAAAQWAGELAIAMRTLKGYTTSLGDKGLELHRALGMRAFAATSDRANGSDPGLYEDLMAAVDALAKVDQLLRRVRDEGKPPEANP
ncbi:hypothetical protein [Amycolatopsis alba]|uniref:Uncharacterized protein n=1 Tax=Amycolatopsis alba DSM 44262 TaxID=1125972 RepID=A0A229RYR9_AMYAL|nr:hypothetical protein [Amycolatopsis alba]OXM51629.1 hypothetical protein CFP75_12670 [Amycolatopsis alba DSM 44262]